jgi:hypothetical protein
MRKFLRPASFTVAATGVLLAMSLPAAGAQPATVRPAPGSPAGRTALPAIPAAPGSYSVLYGVYCNSVKDCWSVGQRKVGEAYENQILHWNGKSWQQWKTPNPGGTSDLSDNELYAVRCLNSTDCWAVGRYLKGTAWLGEALHWTGKKWYSTAVPAPGGTGSNTANELFDSTCTAANNCWAVGEFGLGSNVPKKLLNLVLHWNGKKWSRVRSPNPGGTNLGALNFLNAVRCISASDCNAVGSYGSVPIDKDIFLNEVLHWNGKSWSWVHVLSPAGTRPGDDSELIGLGCGAPTSCWGAGYAGRFEPTETFQNEILHWSGKKWTTVKVPDPGGAKTGDSNFLLADTCDGSANCWAVGEYRNTHDAFVNEALHWNGKRWYYVGTPNAAGAESFDQNYLYAVRCASSSNCWAVGGDQPYLGIETNEILHWNGKHWSIYPA